MSAPKDDFYIGWKGEMADTQSQFLKKRLRPLWIVIPILVALFIFFQRPFNNHFFDFGNIIELTGTYYATPFPMLIADEGNLPKGLAKEILLVGYGKLGATGTMAAIEKEKGSLQGKKITIAGTLIYGDGKTLLELTQEEQTLIAIQESRPISLPTPTAAAPRTLQGEILDPKCYFGVMKPAEGKIHKSCAIRCISGGIPPVFRHATSNASSPYDYYLLLDKTGKTINQEVLSYVGELISLSGEASELLGWKILRVDVGDIIMEKR